MLRSVWKYSFHSSRFACRYREFIAKPLISDSYKGRLFTTRRDAVHSILTPVLGMNTWANPNFRFLKGPGGGGTSKVRTD